MPPLVTPKFVKQLSEPVFSWFEKVEDKSVNTSLNYPSGGPLKVVLFYVNVFKTTCAVAFFTSVLYSILEFGKFFAIELIVDSLNSSSQDSPEALISLIPAFVLVFGILSPFLWLLHSLITQQTLSPTIRSFVQKSLHGNLVQQDIRSFDNRLSGQTTMRLHQAANAVRTGVNLLVDQIPTGFIQFIGTAIMVGAISPIMAGPVIIWLIANVLLVLWLIPRYSRSVQNIVSSASAASGNLSDVYNNILTVKLYDQNARHDPVVIKAIDKQAQDQRVLCRHNTALSCVIQFLNAWLLIGIIVIGLQSIASTSITTGEFAAAVALALRLTTSVDWFVGVGQAIVETYGALKDAQPIFTVRTAPSRKTVFGINKPKIQFEDVSFSYDESAPILNGIDLTVSPGEKIGIIGESGSGKSTIVNLLTALFQPTGGRILIDGVDVASVEGDTLRKQLAVVTQDTALLNRSVEDNILYGSENIWPGEVERTLERTNAAGFVFNLVDSSGRKGLQSLVGEKGMKLSGGERQRIVISRALLRKAKILILDEATSALDAETESAIMAELRETKPDQILVSITHRVSSLKGFDRVFRLKDGKLKDVFQELARS